MADQLSVSLRAWPPEDKTTESLPYLIARINEQKGSFRNVTEASLEEEIRGVKQGESGESGNPGDTAISRIAKDDQDGKAQGDELALAREDIIKHVGEAYNASSHALDLVSLLLSINGPKAAETTVSPFIKAAVPFGSLGTELMHQTQQSEAEKASEDLVSLGWRMNSLARSAESLLNSASRLEGEIERETTYWKEILKVKAKGWPLCRLPRERHTLGVRLGFKEAHAEFRDRGLAALRRGTDGAIELDLGRRWRRDQRLRVRLSRNGMIWATSEEPTAPFNDNMPLTQSLLRARNSLFDEELYHELSREARNLVNHGVRCVDGSVRFPYKDGLQVEVDLVPVGGEERLVEGAEDSTVPEAVTMALRILLSHAHRANLWRRSQPPPPITDSPPPRPFYALLRPILEFHQHESALKAIRELLGQLKRAMSAADLAFLIKENFSSLGSLNALDEPSEFQGSKVETLVNRLLRPHHSQLTFHLPSNRTVLALNIRTSIFPPTFGTSLQLSTISSNPDSGVARMPQTLQLPSIEKFQKHIFYITSLDIISALQAAPDLPSWLHPRSPYQADLAGKNPTTEHKDQLALRINDQGLHMDWTVKDQTGSHSWPASDSDMGENVRSLLDVIKEKIR
ncbi:MAG: hypothetical protein Q9179_004512 [Wetmoreana sp. 5 TL-2023]